MRELQSIISFIVEVEKLKSVERKTKPVGLERYENSAEHSWHVCLSALMLKDYSNEPINIGRVIKMLLIHDLGEIDAGDTIIYASETAENKQKEKQGITRLFEYLPEAARDDFVTLWDEFEAVFAKAIDRIPPLLHNIHGNGHSWQKHKVTKDKVLTFNGQRISQGSHSVWNEIEALIIDAADRGLLKSEYD
ncbi:HD domain-containing protein [Vibrio sp.]|nr:HD domain-containing protein [Vibrio sp.]